MAIIESNLASLEVDDFTHAVYNEASVIRSIGYKCGTRSNAMARARRRGAFALERVVEDEGLGDWTYFKY